MDLVGLVHLVGSVGLVGLMSLLSFVGLVGLWCQDGLILDIFLLFNRIQKNFQIEILSFFIQKNLMVLKYLIWSFK